MDNLQKAILDAVDVITKKHLKNIGCNYYIDGVIESRNPIGTYNVRGTSGDIYKNLWARSNISFMDGDIVQVCVRNGDFSRKFIDDYRLC